MGTLNEPKVRFVPAKRRSQVHLERERTYASMAMSVLYRQNGTLLDHNFEKSSHPTWLLRKTIPNLWKEMKPSIVVIEGNKQPYFERICVGCKMTFNNSMYRMVNYKSWDSRCKKCRDVMNKQREVKKNETRRRAV